jgi:MFS family permease
LPRAAAAEQEGDVERAELRSTPILSAASSMGLLRGIMGFFSFLVAFAFRGGTDGNDLSGVGSQVGAEMRALLLDRDLSTGSVSAARLGLVVGAVVLGQLVASVVASRSRDLVGEQRMIDIALIGTAAVALLCTWVGGLSGAVVLGFVVGVSVNGAKLAFDTIVQQNAPDANYGRSFARFETRFQVIWVLGALVPVVFPIPARIGFFIVFAAATLAAFSYRLGRRADHAGPVRVAPPAVQPLEPVPTVPAERADVDPTTVRPPDPAYDDTRRLPANPPPATNPVDQLPLWDDHR